MTRPYFQIRNNDGPVTWPVGWQHIGDLWRDDKCLACLFIDANNNLRIQAEGAEWDACNKAASKSSIANDEVPF